MGRMRDIRIEHNMAIEFVFSILRYVFSERLETDAQEGNVTLNEEIARWLESVNKKMSPFMRADMLLLFKEFEPTPWTMIKMIVSNNISGPKDFMRLFETTDPEEFIQSCFTYKQAEAEIDYDTDDEELFDHLKEIMEEDKARLFIQFRKHPKEIKRRLETVLRVFYEDFFQEYEDKIREIMELKVKEHNERFVSDREGFLQTIGYGDYGSILQSDAMVKVYVCYIFEYLFAYCSFDKGNVVIITYGYGYAKKFDEKVLRENITSLYKALADDRRLEILRLIGKRKWYSNELAKHFKLSPATMSYHMDILISTGIVTHEAGEQNRLFYKMNKEKLRELFEIALKDLLGE
jgi:DNA-binding transcriptional ArsR family regulator